MTALFYTKQYERYLAADGMIKQCKLDEDYLTINIFNKVVLAQVLGEYSQDIPRAKEELTKAMDLSVKDELYITISFFVGGGPQWIIDTLNEYDPTLLPRLKHITDEYKDNASKLKDSLDSNEEVNLLTKREQEIAESIVKGCSNSEIAENLSISLSTVKYHISNIYSKLEIRSRTKLIAIMKK